MHALDRGKTKVVRSNYCTTLPCRNEFAEYLRRPDHKQEFVSQWQESFNSLQPHLRCEDIMKAELHHRVDVSTAAQAANTIRVPVDTHVMRNVGLT